MLIFPPQKPLMFAWTKDTEGFYNKMRMLSAEHNSLESRWELKCLNSFCYCLPIDLNAENRLFAQDACVNFDLFFLPSCDPRLSTQTIK